MKMTIRTLLVAAVCCLSISNAYAQRYYDDRDVRDRRAAYDRTGTVSSYLDIHLGEAMGHAGHAVGGANLSFLYRFSPDFQFGIGSGLDYIQALALQGKGTNNKNEYDYHGELTLPLFLRGRYLLGTNDYSSASFFTQIDFGYRFGISAYNTGKNSGVKNVAKNFEHCNAKGVFLEPQFGVALNETISFSFGVPIQRYLKNVSTVTIDSAYQSEALISTKKALYLGGVLHLILGF